MTSCRYPHSRAAAVAAAALLAAGCGATAAGRGTGGTGGTGTSPLASRNAGVQFANCMRSHGVTNFPDPGSGGTIQIGQSSAINPQSPSFQAAQKACGRFGPKGAGLPKMTAADRRRALAFAECVRAHGVPTFPDPSDTPPPGARAVIALRGMVFGFSSAFDPRSPAFRHAASACGLKLPGP